MSIENIVQTVMTSKKYSNIIPETINRICNEESIKYKTDKDILRSSKKRLHIISESFLSIANANKIASIKKCIDNDGHIVTNNHVVAGAKNGEVTVSLSNGSTVTGTVIGTDAQTDLAVVKINPPKNIQPIKIGDSDSLQVGEMLILYWI